MTWDLAKLEEYQEQGNAEILLNTEVTDVIVEDDQIVGVMIGEDEVRAPSTIIATGGYGFSEEWLLEYNFDQVKSAALPSADGSGYNFARKAGAAFDRMDYVGAYPGALPVEGLQASLTANTAYPGSILVNKAGERMVDERSADLKTLSDAYRAAAENLIYVVVSEDMFIEDQNLINAGMGSGQVDGAEKLEELLEEGEIVFKADSIEELAEMMNAEKLVSTINQYNTDSVAGADSVFGRSDDLVEFNEGSFYAVKTVPYVLMTQGGPRINDQAQMLTEQDSIIPGAFIAGEIVGSSNVAGNTTIGGMGHGLCTVWGIIAAEGAVANAGK